MGQYYKVVNLDKGEYLAPTDYGNGLKLMEHSWIKNNFMLVVEKLLATHWKKDRIVWAGDYGDEGRFLEPEMSKNFDGDPTLYYFAYLKFNALKGLEQADPDEYRYLINHTKKEFLDKKPLPDKNGWIVHPLSILTSNGNGRGGGDYFANSNQEEIYVGSWAGDSIEVANKVSDGYVEIKPNFIE